MPSKNGPAETEKGTDPGNKPGTPSGHTDFMKDYDVLAPPKRVIKLDGTEIDVSIMSTRVSFQFMAFQKKYEFDEKELNTDDFDPEMVTDMAEILAMICQKYNKKITADWLLDNLELTTLIDLIQVVFKPMIERMSKIKPVNSGGAETKGGNSEKNLL